MSANDSPQGLQVYRMTNTYPCMGAIHSSGEIRPDSSGAPREMICTMAIDGGAYREAKEKAGVGAAAGAAGTEIDAESFKACYCIGSIPTVPPNCHPDNPTCGRYPNDPTKMPAAEHTLSGLEILSLCTPYALRATNFDNKRVINREYNALWNMVCGKREATPVFDDGLAR